MDDNSNVMNTSPPAAPPSSDKLETILSDDFGLFCVQSFLDHQRNEAAIAIDDSETTIEVLDVDERDKFGRFLNSTEYGIWSRYFGLREWYGSHDFEYDDRALFEMFLMQELPVAVLPVPTRLSLGGGGGSGSEPVHSTSSTSLGMGLGMGCAFSSSNGVSSNMICDQDGNDGCDWSCDKFEKYLIETSGDTEFSYTKSSDSHKEHREHPFIKNTNITAHLSSGALKAMPHIHTPHIQVDMQGYDYTIVSIDGDDIGTMTAAKLVSIGTVERLCNGLNKKGVPAIVGHPTPSLLTNIYLVQTTLRHRTTAEHFTSVRYGTPVRTASEPHLAQRHSDLVRFAQQVRPRKVPQEPNRVCVLSFLDHCDRKVVFGQETMVKKKGHEDEILRVELGVKYKDNVTVQQFSASASLTFRVSQGVETKGFWETLEVWCKGVQDAEDLLDHVHKMHGCFNSNFDAKIRFKEFIAISMIQFILQMDSTFNFILCYHCMSGKDRTGMFFAINETVLHFCAALITRLEESPIGQEVDSPSKSKSKRSSKRISLRSSKPHESQSKGQAWLQLFDNLCNIKPTWFDTKVEGEDVGYILDKFMRRSIIITGASTGWFGLKFGIGLKYNFKKGGLNLLKGVKKSVTNYIGANPIAGLLAPHKKMMDWQLDSENADS